LAREDLRRVPLSFGRSKKEEDVVTLITEKKYVRAIEVLRAQMKKRRASTTLRKQLADVLVLAGKKSEAIEVLLPLSDQFAREGFAAKAVSILKKIQKIDPGRRDVDERLARLIEEKQREAVLPLRGPQIGLEEIAIEAPFSGSIDIPVEKPAPETPPARPAEDPEPAKEKPVPGTEDEPTARPSPGPTEAEVPIAMPPPAGPPIPTPPPPTEEAPIPMPPPPTEEAPIPMPAPPESGAEPAGSGPPEKAEKREPEEAEIEDYDLLYVPDDDEAEEEAAVPLVEVAAPAEETPEEVMSDAAFSSELMSLVDSVFQEASEGTLDIPESSPQVGPRRTGNQIVVSPLFRDFSVDEMVAVIQGLKLHSFERGDVIIREGQPGDSLFMLTSGRVRAFRKDPSSRKQIRIADLSEGAFFGEISMLTGQPRNASVVALKRCELLELDRPTLDEITRTHPHVWDVLREFAQKRSQTRA
jgi:hypothetical protein